MHRFCSQLRRVKATRSYTHNAILFGCISSAFVLMNTSAEARVKALSRANCLGFVNESITYDRPDLQAFVGTAVGIHIPWVRLLPTK
jgi:hypothetical protein